MTEYRPADNAGTEKVPAEFVVASYLVPVALLVTTTVAPGMTPLAVSVTAPEMVEVEPPCAYASTDVRLPSRAQSAHTARLLAIMLLPAAWFLDQAVPVPYIRVSWQMVNPHFASGCESRGRVG